MASSAIEQLHTEKSIPEPWEVAAKLIMLMSQILITTFMNNKSIQKQLSQKIYIIHNT